MAGFWILIFLPVFLFQYLHTYNKQSGYVEMFLVLGKNIWEASLRQFNNFVAQLPREIFASLVSKMPQVRIPK